MKLECKMFFRLLILSLFCVLCSASDDFSSFRPDLSTSDPYLPYLRRLPLSGVWDGAVCFSKNTDEIRKFQSRQEHAMQKMLVPEALRADGSNFNLAVAAVYRREFELPAWKPDERVLLTFDDVVGELTVLLNGREAGRNHYKYKTYLGPEGEFLLDVTKYVRAGRNEIQLKFHHSGALLSWGFNRGIYGLVYLDIVPAVHCRRILVTPDSDRKGAAVDCLLAGGSARSARGEIFEWKSGKNVADFSLTDTSMTEYGPMLSGKVRVPSAREWSCESPELYGVRVRNEAGVVMGVQRFGFRTFQAKNGELLLNGKPVFLRGVLPNWFVSRNAIYAFSANPDDVARRYYEQYKKMNVNEIRPNTMTLFRRQYELLDELGFLVRDELSYPRVLLKNSTRAEHIDTKQYGYACDEKGDLHPRFVRETAERLFRYYSHPCIASYSFGNELRDYSPRVTKMLNHIYDLYRKLDKQHRPCMSSSGRYWFTASNIRELYDKKEKYDFISVHDYTGGASGLPFTRAEEVGRDFDQEAARVHAPQGIPVVNGECVYFVDFYYQQKKLLDSIWKSPDAPEPEWDACLDLLNHWYARTPNAKLVAYLLRQFGARNFKYDFSTWRAYHVEHILEANRKLWPGRDGFDILMTNHRFDFFPLPQNFYPFDRAKFGWSKEAEAMRRACAPVGVFTEIVKGNLFTGNIYRNRMTVINNSQWDLSRLTVTLQLTGETGLLQEQKLEAGALKTGEKKILPFQLSLPETPGRYELHWQIATDAPVDRPVYSERFLLESAARIFAPLKTDYRKIALFDEAEKFGKLKQYSTTRLLKRFGVNAQPVGERDDWQSCDLLIIGADSIAGNAVRKQAKKIRSYLENGGRLLVFEQNFSGRIPFLEELEYRLAGPVLFCETLQRRHPLMKDLPQERMFLWNQKDGSVYHNFLLPVSRCAIGTGGNTGGWGTDTFGMVQAHLKVGKGDILFVQAEVTKLAQQDSSAAILARNALTVMLTESTRSLARPYAGMDKCKTRSIPPECLFPLSLKSAANASFADRVAGDRQGAWNDQGPENDLRNFPTGVCEFGGTRYSILEPQKNGGMSCVAVSALPDTHLPKESKPIPVNAKLSRIQFLHTSAWTPRRGTAIGRYLVRYSDGGEREIPLVVGENIGDWWGAPGQALKNAECLWSSAGAQSIVGVFGFDWNNPEPERSIASIRLRVEHPSIVALCGMVGNKQEKEKK